MSLFINRNNPLLLALLLSWLVLGGKTKTTTTSTTLAGNTTLGIIPTIKVEMFNRLPRGASMTIHCKSGDDDLGAHVVGPGKSYYFKFKNNLWETTLFFCGVTWQRGRVVFDIYKVTRDSPRCMDYCMWQARESFIFGFKQGTKVADIVIPWNK